MKAWVKQIEMEALPNSHRIFAETIGIKAALELCEAFGGSTIYIPKNEGLYNGKVRNRAILQRYQEGVKLKRLAVEFGLSEQSIFRIVRESLRNRDGKADAAIVASGATDSGREIVCAERWE